MSTPDAAVFATAGGWPAQAVEIWGAAPVRDQAAGVLAAGARSVPVGGSAPRSNPSATPSG